MRPSYASRPSSLDVRQDLPSGERLLGRTVLEPAYDDRNGSIIYLSTPAGAQR